MNDSGTIEKSENVTIEYSLICLLLDELKCFAKEQQSYLDEPGKQAQQHIDSINHLAMAAETIGLNGFQEICLLIGENTQLLYQEQKFKTDDYTALLLKWPELAAGYLKEINPETSHNLASYLLDDKWPMPLIEQDIQPIVEMLSLPVVISEQPEKPPRQKTATQQDISLALPQDVNNDLLETLLQELPLQTAEFSRAIQKIIKGEGSLDDIDIAQRVAHSLKGAANTVGISGIANLTHHLEDILQALSENRILPSPVIADMLLRAGDCLESMSETLSGSGETPTESLQILQEVLDLANQIDEKGIETIVGDSSLIQPAGTATVNTENSKPQEQEETAQRFSRVPTELLDDLLRLSGENITLLRQSQEQARQIMDYAKALKQKEQTVQKLISELEQLVTIKNLPIQPQQFTANLMESQFDTLELEHYNELHSCTNRLEEAAMDVAEINNQLSQKIHSLMQLTNRQERLQKENQNVVFQSRMVPASTIIPRLERAVRQACRLTGHRAEIQVSGEKTLIDSEILNRLVDPLMHLLRNAVDHGIESPEERQESGKNPSGTIKLSFSRQGNHIEIHCEDDGAGLNLEAIHKKALHKKLLTDDSKPSKTELEQLILTPGFSTRETANQVSGRGIGMDAVYSSIKEMKGNLLLNSTPKKGLSVTLILPVSQLFIHALPAYSRYINVALSNRNIERILPADTGLITQNDDQLSYHFNGEYYPALHIETLLGIQANYDECDLQDHPVLLFQANDKVTHAVFAPSFGNSREMVVKNLGKYIPEIPGIIGVTIDNDGSVIPVIDLPDLLDFSRHKVIKPLHTDKAKIADPSNLPKALVVDDSLSARRALAEFMSDIGFEVKTAINGIDALERIKEQKPDILLVDLEMPRMNGIELTEHLRAKSDTSEIPVIMITSRSTNKHKEYAKRHGVDVYLTKPYQENELIESINMLLHETAPA